MEGMVNSMLNMNFFNNKEIFITGHTGFKGSWLCRILINAGAKITGYSLSPSTDPALFYMADIEKNINSIIGDIRDKENLQKAFKKADPEIVFHLAAQPLVRESYINPVYTYETNVMGTVNLLECIRNTDTVKCFVNITTDKVYRNDEQLEGYVESDYLDGYDPYSNSKSCSELVTHSYEQSFLREKGIAVSTVRAGNVIGGGDFAKDRIIPDCVRAALSGEVISIRNPYAIRPFQHVIEPLMAYLMIAECSYKDKKYAGAYNIGPDEKDCITVGKLVESFCRQWGDGVSFENISEENAPHEAKYLKLNCDKLKRSFNWKPIWNIEKSIEMICKFSKTLNNIYEIPIEMDNEIKQYMEEYNGSME